MRLVVLFSLFAAPLAFGDYITMKCGKNAQKWGNSKVVAEYRWDSNTWSVDQEGAEWQWRHEGRIDRKVVSGVMMRKEGMVAGWLFKEKKPAKGPYRHYFIDYAGGCDSGDSTAGTMVIFQLEAGKTQKKVGPRLRCYCESA